MSDDQIEQKIKEIRGSLQSYEDVDDGYLNESLKELRHVIMFAHYRIERSLELLMVLNMKKEQPKTGTVKSALFWSAVSPIFDRMEFWPKMDACMEMKLIDGKLRAKIERVNTLRKYFSHPASFLGEIREFKDRAKYLEAINDVKSALDALNDLFRPLLEQSLSPSPSPSPEDDEKANIYDVFDPEVFKE